MPLAPPSSVLAKTAGISQAGCSFWFLAYSGFGTDLKRVPGEAAVIGPAVVQISRVSGTLCLFCWPESRA
eukprot:5943479-Pyramimonas_sp.AAC.1